MYFEFGSIFSSFIFYFFLLHFHLHFRFLRWSIALPGDGEARQVHDVPRFVDLVDEEIGVSSLGLAIGHVTPRTRGQLPLLQDPVPAFQIRVDVLCDADCAL